MRAWGRRSAACGRPQRLPCAPAMRWRRTLLGVAAGTRGVPPVGVEPTLGTLLGGRPLPLGYGGWVMIPRAVRTILARANRGRNIRPGSHIQFMHPICECEALPICLDLEQLRTQRSRAVGRYEDTALVPGAVPPI